jgi:DNA helicase-2/ATP-dependent DNA helicase PcrA
VAAGAAAVLLRDRSGSGGGGGGGGGDSGKRLLLAAAGAVYEPYRHACAAAGVVDFADLLCHAVRACREDAAFLAQLRARWTHVLVDEFQDTNEVQLELLRLLVGGGRVTAVGDDCQTIHEHAGARVERILEFADEFAGTVTVKLERNYRSTGLILDAANNVILRNVRRADKLLLCTTGPGERPRMASYASEASEARAVAAAIRDAVAVRREFGYGDVCVLYRLNALSESMEVALKAAGVPHRVVGGVGFFERAEVKDAVAYLVTACNPGSTQHVLRALSVPPRGVGPVAIARLEGMAAVDGCSLPEAAARHLTEFKGRTLSGLRTFLAAVGFCGAGEDRGQVHPQEPMALSSAAAAIIARSGLMEHLHARGEDERAENITALLGMLRRAADEHCAEGGTLADVMQHVAVAGAPDSSAGQQGGAQVTLMSIHRSKGLEWPYVHVVGYADGCMPFRLALDEGNEEGERRLAYVAITRAKRRLVISYPRTRMMYWGKVHQQASRFAGEMGAALERGVAREEEEEGGG